MADATQTLNVHGSIQENYLDEYFEGKVDNDSKVKDWMYVAEGITNVTPKYTDKKKTAAYYNGGGQENTTVTGVTSSYDITGDRSIGNPAQDDIAAMKQKTGSARERMFRKCQYLQNDDGSLTLHSVETGMVTFSDIDDGGGAADDNGGFKTTVSYKSSPATIGPDEADKLAAVLLETPCQNKDILGVELKPASK
ncbi:phage tail tube protein [Furfurilactobacillus sp. WILCCON 0119]